MKPLIPTLGFKSSLSEILPNFDTPTSEDEWHLMMNTNATSVFLCTRAVDPHMIKQQKGKIINITSMQAVRSFVYHVAYAATKGALNVFTRALALEWAKYNINVNGIGPGFVRTQQSEFSYTNEKIREASLRSIPLRKFLQTREIGLEAVFLASEASDYITGQFIHLDGGVLV